MQIIFFFKKFPFKVVFILFHLLTYDISIDDCDLLMNRLPEVDITGLIAGGYIRTKAVAELTTTNTAVCLYLHEVQAGINSHIQEVHTLRWLLGPVSLT